MPQAPSTQTLTHGTLRHLGIDGKTASQRCCTDLHIHAVSYVMRLLKTKWAQEHNARNRGMADMHGMHDTCHAACLGACVLRWGLPLSSALLLPSERSCADLSGMCLTGTVPQLHMRCWPVHRQVVRLGSRLGSCPWRLCVQVVSLLPVHLFLARSDASLNGGNYGNECLARFSYHKAIHIGMI